MARSLIASILFLAACSKEAGNLDELVKIKNEICACKTQACSDDAYDLKYQQWRQGEIEKPSKAWTQRYETIMVDLHACRREIKKARQSAQQ